jgi:hypothetical protein
MLSGHCLGNITNSGVVVRFTIARGTSFRLLQNFVLNIHAIINKSASAVVLYLLSLL